MRRNPVLSIFNRLFEKLIYHRLKSFLDNNNVLFKAQYDFREKHSTQHTILDTVNIIQNNMVLKLFTCGIFIDFKKAFDTVDHAIFKNLIAMASGASLMTGSLHTSQPRSQGLSSYRLGRARTDPGLVWSRVSQNLGGYN